MLGAKKPNRLVNEKSPYLLEHAFNPVDWHAWGDEARRYGWSFVIVDQMPLLLSKYVWDNMGTIIAQRLTNLESLEVTMDAIGGSPLRQVGHPEDSNIVGLTLPEDLAIFRSYLEFPNRDPEPRYSWDWEGKDLMALGLNGCAPSTE